MRMPVRAPVQLLGSASCTLNCRSENVVIKAVIIPELELSDIEGKVFCTDFVERTDDTALEDAPEAFNRLGVNGTDDVLPLGVVNGRVWIIVVEALVAYPLIGAEQANLVRYGFIYEAFQRRRFDVL